MNSIQGDVIDTSTKTQSRALTHAVICRRRFRRDMKIYVQVCLDNSDWSGVAKVSELQRNPSYRDTFQSTSTARTSEKFQICSGIRVITVRVIETHLYNV